MIRCETLWFWAGSLCKKKQSKQKHYFPLWLICRAPAPLVFETSECYSGRFDDDVLRRQRQLVVITPVSWSPHSLSTLSDTVKSVGFPNIHSSPLSMVLTSCSSTVRVSMLWAGRGEKAVQFFCLCSVNISSLEVGGFRRSCLRCWISRYTCLEFLLM